MKRFPRSRAAAAATLAFMLLEHSGVASAQEYPPVSARPAQRTVRALPEAAQGGIRLSLSAAIGLAIANNQDLNVSVNEAEASRYLLFQNMGISAPLLRAAATRSHQKIPAASQLVGAEVDEQNTFSVSSDVTQLFPTGGTFSLGFETRRFSTNSQFFDVNPGKRRSGRPSRFRHYVRFSFGPDEATVTEGVRRIEDLVREASGRSGPSGSPR